MVTSERQTETRTTWAIDPVHSTAEFAVKHMMVSTVRGHFQGISGTITLDTSASLSIGGTLTNSYSLQIGNTAGNLSAATTVTAGGWPIPAISISTGAPGLIGRRSPSREPGWRTTPAIWNSTAAR